jgi:hypothetical protein
MLMLATAAAAQTQPASGVAKPAKPSVTAAAVAKSAASSSSGAAKPKPAAKPMPAVAATVPVECLTFDISPFGPLQGVDITGPSHAAVHFDVEVASAPAQRGQGMMCRQRLPMGRGMLFEFPKAGEQIFWMHDTLIPLDILYIAPDGHIVSITRAARPKSDRKLPSHGDANGVLEINGGLADKFGLKPGDVVAHPFFMPAVSASVAASSSASSQ